MNPNETLLEALFSIERASYPRHRLPVVLAREERLKKEIREKGTDHVIVCTMTNMGQEAHAVVLDTFKSGGPYGTKKVVLCACGDSFAWDGEPLKCGMQPL